ncbi:MAG: dTMP kinase [Longimicrobiales bacterium]
MKRCFGNPPPTLDLSKLTGALIVIEGPDSSGRSTHISLLAEWLEQNGFPVAQVGLKRSQLVGKELEQAKLGNILSPRTMSLFYATDFYDQLENRIVPALRAGSVVLADRYIFTLIARDTVRGADADWLRSLYSKAIVPDAVFYFQVSARALVDRTLLSRGGLDYWESGMDLGLSRDWFGSFVRYQRRMRAEFRKLEHQFHFEIVNANRSVPTVHAELKDGITRVLHRVYPSHNKPIAAKTP